MLKIKFIELFSQSYTFIVFANYFIKCSRFEISQQTKATFLQGNIPSKKTIYFC